MLGFLQETDTSQWRLIASRESLRDGSAALAKLSRHLLRHLPRQASVFAASHQIIDFGAKLLANGFQCSGVLSPVGPVFGGPAGSLKSPRAMAKAFKNFDYS